MNFKNKYYARYLGLLPVKRNKEKKITVISFNAKQSIPFGHSSFITW